MTATIYHASDLHFGAEDRGALAWFAGDVDAARPELVLVTGDITQAGRRREFEAAAEWLESLAAPVIIAPGNHDLPVYNLFERFVRPYRRYARLAGRLAAPPAFDGFAVISLKTTARAQPRLNWAEGRVDRRSLDAAVAEIEALTDGAPALVASHHPLIDLPGMSVPGRTHGGRAALSRLAQAGAAAILTGHVHEPHDHLVEAVGRQIRMIGAGTLSERLRRERPSYNVLRIGNGSLEVEVARLGD
jgi:3',5'-cyclic AMP phosphodiesterase CpdA